jgi:tRNA (cmo5U34)-methyltransferase
MTRVADAFDRDARFYDPARRRLVPCFDGFYGAALDALPLARDAEASVLDLGAGTGLMTALVSERHPRACFTLVDVAGEMLAQARVRFSGAGGERFRFVHADFGALAELGRHDAVVSALAIHHLEAPAKRRLFAAIHRALAKGGVFVNADQVAGETDAEDAAQRASWAAEARALGSDDAELAAARERMREDRPSTVSEQLRWLAEAGFERPACVFRHGMFAVFATQRA